MARSLFNATSIVEVGIIVGVDSLKNELLQEVSVSKTVAIATIFCIIISVIENKN